MNLDSLVLHPKSRRLATKIAQHLPHGLIIEGPTGTGVASVARALAHDNKSPELVIHPKKKLKNEWIVDLKEGSIVIEDIRQLYLQTRTRQPESHVYILNTGEKSMTHGAQNAFLKLLEEPRAGLHFIIATHHKDQLLPTILSRCQTLSLHPVTTDQTKALIENLGITDATKQARLAFVGNGKPALITRLANDEKQYDARVAIMQDAKTLISGSEDEKLFVLNRYRDNRADSLTLIDDINHQLHVVLRRQPDHKLVAMINNYLDARERIAAGGNIRLQMTASVL